MGSMLPLHTVEKFSLVYSSFLTYLRTEDMTKLVVLTQVFNLKMIFLNEKKVISCPKSSNIYIQTIHVKLNEWKILHPTFKTKKILNYLYCSCIFQIFRNIAEIPILTMSLAS